MALIVVTGGSRSGKSSAAQRLAERAARDRGVVVAVFGKASDEEMADRVAAHRRARPASFETLEARTTVGWADGIDQDALLVIDCLGTALGTCMEECWPADAGVGLTDAHAVSLPEGYGAAIADRFGVLVDAILAREGDTIVVTNEVGSGLVSAWASGRAFGDLLGGANRRLVAAADAAYLAVAGKMVDLKALPADIPWPTD